MDMPASVSAVRSLQEDLLKGTVPFQEAWQRSFFWLPLTFLAEALRFSARRLQAQSDFIAGLEACNSVPEVIEAQSRFVRAAVGDYGTQTSKIVDDMRKTVSQAA